MRHTKADVKVAVTRKEANAGEGKTAYLDHPVVQGGKVSVELAGGGCAVQTLLDCLHVLRGRAVDVDAGGARQANPHAWVSRGCLPCGAHTHACPW